MERSTRSSKILDRPGALTIHRREGRLGQSFIGSGNTLLPPVSNILPVQGEGRQRPPERVRQHVYLVFVRVSRISLGSCEVFPKIGQKLVPKVNIFPVLYAYLPRMVLVRARGIFLGLDVREEFQHPSLTWSNKSSEKLTFDVWVGDQHLALEYQGVLANRSDNNSSGEHHYSRISSRQDLDIVSQRDRLKKLKCNENEIHLVAVPYWWDQKEETLRRLIEEGVNPNYS